MSISREEVLHVARLARLALTDEEVERITDELGAILDAVGVVAELDLEDVPPTSHPLDLVNVWDEDEPRSSLGLDDAFANAACARRRPLPRAARPRDGTRRRHAAPDRGGRDRAWSSVARSRRASSTPPTSRR